MSPHARESERPAVTLERVRAIVERSDRVDGTIAGCLALVVVGISLVAAKYLRFWSPPGLLVEVLGATNLLSVLAFATRYHERRFAMALHEAFDVEVSAARRIVRAVESRTTQSAVQEGHPGRKVTRALRYDVIAAEVARELVNLPQ